LESAFIKIRIMEVIGKVKLMGETQTFGSNGFRKRELVVTTDEQYPQMIMIEFVQDKCDLLNSYSVGQAEIVLLEEFAMELLVLNFLFSILAQN